MRILHTSDWHIGRQFHGVSLLEDQNHILKEIIEILKDKNVDVLIIAGDIYDRSIPPTTAVESLDKFFNIVSEELKIPVVLISGNHDSAARLGFGSKHMSRSDLHITGPLKEEISKVILKDEFGDVSFYGLPYVEPSIVKDVFDIEINNHDEAMGFLTNKIKEDVKNGDRTIVLSHCYIDGAEPCESERPLSMGGADRVSYKHFEEFSYTALGHLHGRQFKGLDKIRYSGSILKYSFSEENHKKSVAIVDLDKDGNIEVEQVELSPIRDMRSITDTLQNIIDNSKDDKNTNDYLLIKLTDENAILDPMSKVRDVYPNTLHLERPGLMKDTNDYRVNRDILKKSELDMFKDFFEQVQDTDLDDSKLGILSELITHIHKGESN